MGQGAPKLALQLTPREPQQTLDKGGKRLALLINLDATYWVLNTQDQANSVTKVVKLHERQGRPKSGHP